MVFLIQSYSLGSGKNMSCMLIIYIYIYIHINTNDIHSFLIYKARPLPRLSFPCMCIWTALKSKHNFYVDRQPQSMRKTSTTITFINMLMKHLKFAIAIPFKVLIRLIHSLKQYLRMGNNIYISRGISHI